LAQQLEVVRDRRLGQVEYRGEFADTDAFVRLGCGDQREQAEPDWVAEGFEDGRELGGLTFVKGRGLQTRAARGGLHDWPEGAR
jgi:hypothetical protein